MKINEFNSRNRAQRFYSSPPIKLTYKMHIQPYVENGRHVKFNLKTNLKIFDKRRKNENKNQDYLKLLNLKSFEDKDIEN
jgi:hypothetical protein